MGFVKYTIVYKTAEDVRITEKITSEQTLEEVMFEAVKKATEKEWTLKSISA